MSKYSVVTGEDLNVRWGEFMLTKNSTEGQLMAVNDKYIAASWDGSFANIAILDKFAPQRVSPKIPLIRAHKKNITDLRWSPFIPNLLASASEEGTVKLWQLPDDGIKDDVEKEKMCYQEHGKKVLFIKFHPSSADLMASACNGKTIKIWNLEGKTYTTTPTEDSLTSFEWNYNGSLIGCMARNKNIYIYDVRAQKAAVKSKALDSTKIQKMCFVGPENYVAIGNEKGKRVISLYDMKKPEAELSKTIIDTNTSINYPLFDYDSNILFLPAKGETNVHFYTFSDGKINFLHSPYKMKDAPANLTFEDKRNVNVNKNEMTKIYRSTEKHELFVTSLYVPQKSGKFEAELYPDTFAGKSALTGEEWASGTDKDPIKKPITEVGTVKVSP